MQLIAVSFENSVFGSQLKATFVWLENLVLCMLPKGRLFGLWKPKSGPCMLEDFGGIRKETTVPRSPKCTLGDNKKEAFMRRFSLIT